MTNLKQDDKLLLDVVEAFRQILAENAWTQSGVARATGLSQPNISTMLNNPLSRTHSWARIVEALPLLGMDVTIAICQSNKPVGSIRINREGKEIRGSKRAKSRSARTASARP